MATSRSIAIVAFSPLAACTLLVDTGGLSGDPGDDAGATETSSHDAPPEVVGSDSPAPPPTDAGAEAAFSDDFDDTALGATWTEKEETRGSLSLADDAVSKPHALRAELTGGPGSVEGDISLRRDIAKGEKNIRCELDMKIVDALPATAEIDLLELVTIVNDPPDYELYLAHIDNIWQLGEYAKYSDGGKIDRLVTLGMSPPIGSWTHVTFVTDGAKVSIAFDGVSAGTLDSLTAFASTSKHVGIGYVFVDKSSPSAGAVLYDNVACYVAP